MTDSINDVNSLVRDVILAHENLDADEVDFAIKYVLSSRKYKKINDQSLDNIIKDVISIVKYNKFDEDEYINKDSSEKEKEKPNIGPAKYNPYEFLDNGLNEIIRNSQDKNLQVVASGYIDGTETLNRYIVEKAKFISQSTDEKTYNELVFLLRNYIDEFGGEDITNCLVHIFAQNPKLTVSICSNINDELNANLEKYKEYLTDKLFSDNDFLDELNQLEEEKARQFLQLIHSLQYVLGWNFNGYKQITTILRKRISIKTDNFPPKAYDILSELNDNPDKFKIYCRSMMSKITKCYNHFQFLKKFFHDHPHQIKYLAPKDQRVEYQRAAVESDPFVIRDIIFPDFQLSKEVIKKNYMLLGRIIKSKIKTKEGIEFVPDPTLKLKGTIPLSLTDEQKVNLMFLAILKCLSDTDTLNRMIHFTESDQQEFVSNMFFGMDGWKELIQKYLKTLMGIIFQKMGKQGLWCFMTFLNKALGISLDEQEIMNFIIKNS